MERKQFNFANIFIMLFIGISFQLCFFENMASAGMQPIVSPHPYSPEDNSTGVAVDTNLSVTFNYNWLANDDNTTGYISIYENGGTLFERYYFDDPSSYPANITGEGTPTLTIDPSVDLDPGTSYYVLFDADIIGNDTNTNNYPGSMGNTTTWNFTTAGSPPCYNPPSCNGPCFGTDDIDHLSPPDNARFMQTYEGFAIVFGTTVTLGTGNIYIRLYSDDSTIETIDVTSGNVTGWGTNTLTINPIANLANNTHYYVNFDMEGWSLAADKDKWDFWTKSSPNTFSGAGL